MILLHNNLDNYLLTNPLHTICNFTPKLDKKNYKFRTANLKNYKAIDLKLLYHDPTGIDFSNILGQFSAALLMMNIPIN